MRAAKRFMSVLVMNVVCGVPTYFIAFIYAYGFRESVGLREHVSFLTMIAAFAVVAGVLGAGIPWAPLPKLTISSRAVFGVLTSLALNSVVIGVGSIVSAAHKDEGSVSADFTFTTDVLVATGLFVVAAVLSAVAIRVDSRAADPRS